MCGNFFLFAWLVVLFRGRSGNFNLLCDNGYCFCRLGGRCRSSAFLFGGLDI